MAERYEPWQRINSKKGGFPLQRAKIREVGEIGRKGPTQPTAAEHSNVKEGGRIQTKLQDNK